MLRTRSWVGDGSSPAAATASATASVSRIARICMLPREVNSMRSEPNRLAACGQRLQLHRGDHAAGQPHPRQRAVGRLVHLQRAGTGVLVAGAAHPLTVRSRG